MSELNEQFSLEFADVNVITVPIDETLTRSGEAADAAAVGAALELKADRTQITSIDVNGQSADRQGHIILAAGEIPMVEGGSQSVAQAVEAAAGRTGADIPLSAETGAPSIADAVAGIDGMTAATIPMAAGSEVTIGQKVAAMDQATAANTVAISELSGRAADQIPVETGGTQTVKEALDASVKRVNGATPDEAGSVIVQSVPFAENLESSASQTSTGTYVARASGEEASIDSGSAWLMGLRGHIVHGGYVPESLTMTITEAGELSHLSAEIDRDTFVEMADDSGTYTFVYSGSGWLLNGSAALLGDYGITITGEPVAGDTISVAYVAENRGLIVAATPTAFRSTGWNLYDNAVGYARVVRYSTEYGFAISGTYTALQYSATETGTRSDITVVSGHFTVPGDGYVWVTGGNSTDTAIWMTHSDWTDAYPGSFAAYTSTEIDLSAVMEELFPDGLLQVGGSVDEINLNVGQAISRVEVLEYTAENLALAKASGREYEYDETRILLARAEAVISSISGLDGGYTANDHGMEIFVGTTVGVTADTLYGANLKNKLERDVVTLSQQTLTSAQQSQVRTNLGAASQADLSLLNSSLASLAARVETGITSLTGQCTFKESVTGTNTRIHAKNGVVYVYYQGEAKTHTADPTDNANLLFTLPAAWAPSGQIYVPFIANNLGYGVLAVAADGTVRISTITSTTIVARVYAAFSYPIVQS